jgi:hypothetical protein
MRLDSALKKVIPNSVSVLHGNRCLQSVKFFFLRQYVQSCLLKNPKLVLLILIFFNLLNHFWHTDKNFCFYAEVNFWDFARNDNSNKHTGSEFQWYRTYERGYETSGSHLRFMLRRSSLVECVSVLHGNQSLQSVKFFFLRQYVQSCTSQISHANNLCDLHADMRIVELTISQYFECLFNCEG